MREGARRSEELALGEEDEMATSREQQKELGHAAAAAAAKRRIAQATKKARNVAAGDKEPKFLGEPPSPPTRPVPSGRNATSVARPRGTPRTRHPSAPPFSFLLAEQRRSRRCCTYSFNCLGRTCSSY